MKSYLRSAWAALTSKLGAFAALIPKIAKEIEIGIAENDVNKVLAGCDKWDVRAHETREALAAGDELTAHLRKAVADGKLSPAEGATGALLVEKLIDEAEDIVTGVDEDDPQEGGATP